MSISDKLINQSVLTATYQKLGMLRPQPANRLCLYRWQQDIWNKRTASYLAACVATAGGKSVVIKSCGVYNAKQGMKVIVIAPSTMIVDDLGADHTMMCDRWGTQIGEWNPALVLVDSNENDAVGSSIEAIVNFLLDQNLPESKRTLVCCYASFVQAVAKVKSKFLTNTFICIDEAHHIQVNDTDEMGNNELGGAIKRFVADDSNKLWYFTATPFRTNHCRIFSQKQDIEVYSLKLDDMLEDIEINEWLKHIQLSVLVDESYADVIQKTWVDGRHTAIWISNTGANTTNTKLPELLDIIKSIGEELFEKPSEVDDEEWQQAQGIIHFIRTRTGGLEKLLDLAIDVDRDRRKEYLHKYRSNGHITVVTALNMFTEGYNWKPLDTIYVYGQRTIQGFIQIMGRGLRPFPNKDTLRVNMVLQGVNFDDENFESLNKYVNAIWACSLLDDYFMPLDKILKAAGQTTLLKKVHQFNKEVPDYDERMKLIAEVGTQLSAFKSRHLEEHELPATSKEQKEFVEEWLARKGYKTSLADSIILHLKVRAVRSVTGNMYVNDFVAIEKSDTFDVMTSFVSKICDKKTLIALRDYLTGNRWTTDTIVKEFKKVHGNRYDYSKVKYVKYHEKVTIICKEHGEFTQTVANHLQGQCCPMCYGRNKTTDDFIREAKETHGDKFDYSKVKYVGATVKITIICKEHGEFEQLPAKHLQSHGCPKCYGFRKTTGDFVLDAIKVHGKRYDYSKVEYFDSRTKITIICKEHGAFTQTAHDHLRGCGCPMCAGTKKKTTADFISDAKKMHGNKFDYSKVKYVDDKTKVIIICKEHGEFKQIPSNHLQGNGCPLCKGKRISEAKRKNAT